MISVAAGCICDKCGRRAKLYDPFRRLWLCGRRCFMDRLVQEDEHTLKLRKEASKEAARRKRDKISNKKAKEKRDAARKNTEVWQQKKPTVPFYKTGHRDIRP